MRDPTEAFEKATGATVKAVVLNDTDDNIVRLVTNKGDLQFYHRQDCCEFVDLNDVAGGELEDLIGERIEEIRVDESIDGDPKPREWSESWTWTFYTIRTNRLTLVLRFLGESNGYYGESVDIAWEASDG